MLFAVAFHNEYLIVEGSLLTIINEEIDDDFAAEEDRLVERVHHTHFSIELLPELIVPQPVSLIVEWGLVQTYRDNFADVDQVHREHYKV